MATLVQLATLGSSTATPGTLSAVFGAPVTAGNTVIVVAKISRDLDASASTRTLTGSDTAGNSYTLSVAAPALPTSDVSGIQILRAKIVTGGFTDVTVNFGSRVERCQVHAFEVSGLDTTTPEEATNSGSGSSTNPTAGNVTTAGGGFLVASVATLNASGDPTQGTSWTLVYNTAQWGGFGLERRAPTAGGTYAGDFAMTPSDSWTAVIAAFKDAAGGGSSTITADQGSFALTGQATNLLFNRAITADYGAYSLTGQDVTLAKETPGAFTLTADSGTYNWNGQDALADYAMNADAGSYSFSGQEVTFSIGVPAAYSLIADAGSYSLTGQNARLDWSGAPIVPNRQAGIYMGMRIGL